MSNLQNFNFWIDQNSSFAKSPNGYFFIDLQIIHNSSAFGSKAIVEKSRGEGSLMEQDTIENVF